MLGISWMFVDAGVRRYPVIRRYAVRAVFSCFGEWRCRVKRLVRGVAAPRRRFYQSLVTVETMRRGTMPDVPDGMRSCCYSLLLSRRAVKPSAIINPMGS
jgi:hypothetical protein